MPLMPAYYTTNSTKKRKAKKKPGWKEREAAHKKRLIALGIDPDKKPSKKKEFTPYIPPEDNRRETKYIPSLGNGIGNAPKSDTTYKEKVSSQYVIGQAYNKGGIQVLSKAEVADPMTGKRR